MTRQSLLIFTLAFAAALLPVQAQDNGQAGAARGRGGQGGAAGGRNAGRGGRRGGFPQFTREGASQDVLARGKALYETNCASCHAPDLRGTASGTRLMRSGTALSDKHGELIAAAVAKHSPVIHLVEDDSTAIAEYIHSILATAGPQGSPPGRNPVGLEYNLLVGDAKAGEAYFAKGCAGCHSVTGDLKGIATRFPDVRTLQNNWVAGSTSAFGGRGGGTGGYPVAVTMPDGKKFEGKLIRKDDYIVVMTLADGTRKSITRDGDVPKVEVKDPNEAHKQMVLALDDPENKNLHDVTAYLATLK
jgi:cytochrome c oxidase cbb3-type subunit 3